MIGSSGMAQFQIAAARMSNEIGCGPDEKYHCFHLPARLEW